MAPAPLGIPIWTTLHSGALLGILHGEVPKPATGLWADAWFPKLMVASVMRWSLAGEGEGAS
jgi:hypothetical protein